MNKGINYKKGRRRKIIEYLYLVGIIPYNSLPLIDENTKMIKRVIKEMEQEGVVIVDKRGGAKNIRLQKESVDKEKYEKYIEKDCLDYYYNTIRRIISRMPLQENIKEKESVNTKILKDSATQILMKASGISIGVENERENACQTKFYISKEYKSQNEEISKKNSSSRVNGIMQTKSGYYPVYNIGNRLIVWKQTDERKLAANINMQENKIFGSAGEMKEKECIVIADNDSLYARICLLNYGYRSSAIKQTKLINIDYTYDKMYAVPNNKNGKKLLQIMSQEKWKEKIYKSILTKEDLEASVKTSVPCDGYIESERKYVFAFLVPDIVKLKLFLNRANLEQNKKRFVLYCYSFQMPLLSMLIEQDYITILKIDIDTYIERIFPGIEEDIREEQK